MAYIPANPHYAVVNCKIGDLNLTPIPPNALESFTFERDTTTKGNKFTIIVHDETAIVMESYLAEAMAKAKASQSYDFDLQPLTNLQENVDLNDYLSDEAGGLGEVIANREEEDKKDEENKEEDQPATASVMSLGLDDDTSLFLDQINTNLIGSNAYSNESMSNATETVTADSLRDLIGNKRTYASATTDKKFSNDNESPLNSNISGEDTTSSISGGEGVTTTEQTTRSITQGNTSEKLVIDNGKIAHADPMRGLRVLFGKTVPEDTWVSSGAIDEFSNGFDSTYSPGMV